MSTIDELYEDFGNFQKKLGFFKKKSKSLSRLKLDFFEKMREHEYNENIEKAKQYYGYLRRATHLSYSIYHRMYQEFSSITESLSIENFSGEEAQALEQITSSQVRGLYEQLHKSQANYVKQMNVFLKKINQEDIISQLEHVIEIEKTTLDTLGNAHEDLFGELTHQATLHTYLKEEKDFSDTIINAIEQLNKETQSFVEKIQEYATRLLQELKRLSTTIRNKPFSLLVSPAERTGIVLEKHASLFAATIVSLSLAGKLAHLFGFGYIGVMAEQAILLLAEVGEGFQSIPFMRELPQKIRGQFSQFSQTIHSYSSNTLQGLKSLKTASFD